MEVEMRRAVGKQDKDANAIAALALPGKGMNLVQADA